MILFWTLIGYVAAAFFLHVSLLQAVNKSLVTKGEEYFFHFFLYFNLIKQLPECPIQQGHNAQQQ